MADVAVVTASFGGHDKPRDIVAQTVDADWYYFTDDRFLNPPFPWNPMRVGGIENSDPRMEAKAFRMVPWEFLDQSEFLDRGSYRHYVWIDGSMEVISETFLEEAIEAVGDAPLAAWKHPRRDDIYEEVDGSLREAPEKYEPIRQRLKAQVAAYDLEGFPPASGLYATGTLVWNMENPRTRDLGRAWLTETRLTTYQDQISLPVVAWRLGVGIATFPYDQVPPRRFLRKAGSLGTVSRHVRGCIENRWVRIWPHERID